LIGGDETGHHPTDVKQVQGGQQVGQLATKPGGLFVSHRGVRIGAGKHWPEPLVKEGVYTKNTTTKIMKNHLMLTLGLLLGAAQLTLAQTDSTAATKDLPALGLTAKDHTRLIAMLRMAGLEPKAKEAGPFTVFAPTNVAFAKLPASTADNLLKPAYRARLIQVLTLHVVPGMLTFKDLQDGQPLKTVGGETLTVQRINDLVTITDAQGNKATITRPNIRATNGIVHVIDTVLMPR
jgi:uncharacterized surface protein with fasciclin (FAS1) repeats